MVTPTVTDNSPFPCFQDYSRPDDHTMRSFVADKTQEATSTFDEIFVTRHVQDTSLQN